MRCASILGVVIALTCLSIAPATAQESFTPIVGWDQQLFPSYALATATMRHEAPEESDEEGDGETSSTLGDAHGLLGVEVEAPEDDTTITVTVECPELMDSSTFEGVLPSGGTTYDVFPSIRYHYKELVGNKQATPIAISFTVTIGDEEPETRTETAILRPVNDCPWSVAREDAELADTCYMVAAYVNEQHPFVDMVLREALNDGVVDSFTGYQSGDPGEVYRQVYALWNALSERDVRYSNITTSVAVSGQVSAQHVRMIDESINNNQANCVDGAVLFASLMRKIDIEPVVVSIPGHCYVAFYLDQEQTMLIGLETTLIGSESDEETNELPGAEEIVDGEWLKKNSWHTFCAAIAMGTADMIENKDKFNKEDPDYQLVPIEAARARGILPIAFDASSTFKAREEE